MGERWRKFCCWLGGRGVVSVPVNAEPYVYDGWQFESVEFRFSR